MKIRIDPRILLLAVVAALPFVVVALNRPAEEDELWRRVQLNWISVELPGTIHETQTHPSKPVHYVATASAGRMAMLAMIIAPPQSAPRKALASGAPAVRDLFEEFFATADFDQVQAEQAPEGTAYLLQGFSPHHPGGSFRARLWLDRERNVILVALAAAPRPRQAEADLQRILQSHRESRPAAEETSATPADTGGEERE